MDPTKTDGLDAVPFYAQADVRIDGVDFRKGDRVAVLHLPAGVRPKVAVDHLYSGVVGPKPPAGARPCR